MKIELVASVVSFVLAIIVAYLSPGLFDPPAALPIRVAALTAVFLGVFGLIRLFFWIRTWFARQKLQPRLIDKETHQLSGNGDQMLLQEGLLQQERRLERRSFYVSLALVTAPLFAAEAIYPLVGSVIPNPLREIIHAHSGLLLAGLAGLRLLVIATFVLIALSLRSRFRDVRSCLEFFGSASKHIIRSLVGRSGNAITVPQGTIQKVMTSLRDSMEGRGGWKWVREKIFYLRSGTRLGGVSVWLYLKSSDVFVVQEIATRDEDSEIYGACIRDYTPKAVSKENWNKVVLETKSEMVGSKLREIGSDIGFVFATGVAELAGDIFLECQVHDRYYLSILRKVSPEYEKTHRLRSAAIVPINSSENGNLKKIGVLAMYSPYPKLFTQLDVDVASWHADLLGDICRREDQPSLDTSEPRG
jgi:hypothetical protein